MGLFSEIGPGLTAAVALVALSGGAVAQTVGDAAKGEQLFKMNCTICHNPPDLDKSDFGPSLHGVVGRHVASYGGYSYSTALKARDWTWDAAQLDKWLTAPMVLVPGTNMTFDGVRKPQERADLIAYLTANSPK